MGKSKTEIRTLSLVTDSRQGAKKMQRMADDGWRVVATASRPLSRATAVTFERTRS